MNFYLFLFFITFAFVLTVLAFFYMTKKDKPNKNITKVVFIMAVFTVVFVIAFKPDTKEKEIIFFVGEEQINTVEYNFYRTMLINGFNTLYEDSLDTLNLDVSKDLSEQECIFQDYETWEDFFKETTEETIIAHTALLNDANKTGYTYDSKEDWSEFYKQVAEQADKYNLTVSKMLKQMYGNNATESDIKGLFEKYVTANNYKEYLEETMEVTEKEVSEELENNQSLYYSATYLQYDIEADAPDEATDAQIEAAMEKAKTKAKDFYDSVNSEETFEKEAEKNAAGTNIDIRKNNVSYDNVDSAIREKLFSCDEEGQIFFIEDNTNHCYKIIYFISKEIDKSNTATVRQILVTPISSGGSYLPSEEDYKKASLEAKNIEEMFLETNQSEEEFAKIAKSKSSDVGTAENGGLLTFVESGTYDKEMDEWIFDSRKPGDVGIVETTYGYHILYFVEYTDPIWKVNITNTLRHNKADEYIDNLILNYPITYPEPDGVQTDD